MRICRRCGNEYPAKQGSQRTLCKGCLSIVCKENSNKNKVFHPQGKRKIDKSGYAWVYVGGQFVSEHRLIMEQILKRKLLNGESVHHKNGVRHDNSPDNLELWVVGVRYGQRATDIKCFNCGESYRINC